MADIEQLRRTLVAHEDLATDATGLIEAVQGAAARIRRRRRAGYTAAAAVATAVALGLVPAAVRGPNGPVAASSPAVPHYRDATQLTLAVAADGGNRVILSGVVGSTQYAVVRREAEQNPFAGTVLVYDPGTYDAKQLLAGRPVTVRDHPASFVPALAMGDQTVLAAPSGGPPSMQPMPVAVPAVGWRDGSGAWVVVIGDSPMPQPDTEGALLRTAAAVTLSAPTDVRTPFHFGYIPAGLPPTQAQLQDDESWIIGFGGRRQWQGDLPPVGPDVRIPLSIQVQLRSDYVDQYEVGKPPTAQIAGHDVWYSTDPKSSGHGFLETGSGMVVRAGRCSMTILVADRNQIPYSELVKMVTDIRFTDCGDPATFVPVIG